MKRLIPLLFIVLSSPVMAQKGILEHARIAYDKFSITIYTDSTFTNKKAVTSDFQKFKLIGWKKQGWQVIKSGLSRQPIDTVYIKDDQFIKTPEYREVLESYDPSFKAKHNAYYNALVKSYGKKIADGIYDGVPVIGMTTGQFYMVKDKPNRRNATNATYGTSEQLVYNSEFGTKYYYFTNGKLTAIQE